MKSKYYLACLLGNKSPNTSKEAIDFKIFSERLKIEVGRDNKQDKTRVREHPQM